MSKAETRRVKKQRKEKRRRLDIMKEIRKNGTIAKVIELQEHWMTLILNNKKWNLECEIFGDIFSIKDLADVY